MVPNDLSTGDKGMRKKIICLKMVSREATKEAITDIILLTKSKRAPEGYTYAGYVYHSLIVQCGVLVYLIINVFPSLLS